MIKVRIRRKCRNGGLEGFLSRLPKALGEGVENAAEDTQKLAVRFSRGRVADGIQIEIFDTGTLEVKSRIYTTSLFSAFLEYGTGIYMEPNPLGHIPGSAGDRGEPWYVHESMADLSKYNFPKVTFTKTNADGSTVTDTYYILRGTHAHPYMKPAGMESRVKSVEEITASLKKLAKEVSL